VKVNKAVPLCSEAVNCTLGALASHNDPAFWHFVSALLRCMQGPVVCAVSADRIWWDKALECPLFFTTTTACEGLSFLLFLTMLSMHKHEASWI